MNAAPIAKLRKRPSPFTMVPNKLINDSRVSFRAKGIWALIGSKPDGWTCREGNLVAASTEGRDAFRAAAKELIEFGWLRRFQERTDQGHFCTVYELLEEPLTENPSTVQPSTDNQAPYKDGESKKENNLPLTPSGSGVWEDDLSFMEVCKAYAALNADRVDTRKAWEAWTTGKLESDAEAILKALPHYASGEQWRKEGGRFIPSLSKWLSDRGWKNVAAGLPTADQLRERERIGKAGLSAYARIETDKVAGREPSHDDVEAVRRWEDMKAGRLS